MNDAQEMLIRELSTTLFPGATLVSAKRHRVVMKHTGSSGESIYTKVFVTKRFLPLVGRIFVLLRARREDGVLRRLQAVGLAAPTPLGWGRANLADGRAIAYAQTLEVSATNHLSSVIDGLVASDPLRVRLLEQYGTLLADLHTQGLLPGDFHFGNILLAHSNSLTSSEKNSSLIAIDHESTRAYLAFLKPLRRRNLSLSMCRSANPSLEASDDISILRGYQVRRVRDDLLSQNLRKDSLKLAQYRARDLVRKRRRHRLQRRKREIFAQLTRFFRLGDKLA